MKGGGKGAPPPGHEEPYQEWIQAKLGPRQLKGQVGGGAESDQLLKEDGVFLAGLWAVYPALGALVAVLLGAEPVDGVLPGALVGALVVGVLVACRRW